MKIGELFVALGFDIQGGDDLIVIEKTLDKAAGSAGKLALGVDALVTGFLFMVDTATKAALALQNFTLQTGLQNDGLQKVQHAAKLAGVTGEELTQTIKGIQAEGAKIALGQGNVAPWALLGISPTDDPFKVFAKIREGLQSLDPGRVAAARVIAQQAGIGDNVFAFLRRKDIPLDDLKELYILTTRQQGSLVQLGKDWADLTDRLGRSKNVFSAEVAPSLDKLVTFLIRVIDKVAEFVHWLDSGTPAANLAKNAIIDLGIAFGVFAAAITAFAAVAKIGAVAAGLFNTAILPEIAVLAAIAAAVWLAVDAYEALVDVYHRWKGDENFAPGGGGFGGHGAGGSWEDIAKTPGHGAGGSTTVNQTNTIQVHGAGDPAIAARRVHSELSKALSDAAFSGPARSQ